MLEARPAHCASQKLEAYLRKILLYIGVQIWEKISFKRKIALIFKYKTNNQRKKFYCSRKGLEEAG